MKSFSLIQLYFVLATLVGLILMVIGAVTLSKIGLDKLVGVKPYPEFSAPYPPTFEYKDTLAESTPAATKKALEAWQKDYEAWQQSMKEYNTADQQIKRDLTQSLAMLLVGLPVFFFHSPKVFKKEN